MRIVDSKPLG